MNRNPYVILGVAFGATRAEANIAFARKARGLRRGSEDADQLTDLTWALHRIDEAIKQPATAMEIYRIPADPGALGGEGEGILRPPPERLRAREGDRDRALSSLGLAAAREYLRYLTVIRAARIQLPPP